MDSKAVLGLALGGGLLYWLIKKAQPAQAMQISEPSYTESADTAYMTGDTEFPETNFSSDDVGGTAFYQLDTHLPISRIARGGPLRPRGFNRREIEVDYPTFTGGTFIHPEFLPPVRTAHLQ